MDARLRCPVRKASAPTAKDYIQDGLIAMWDGIENAGWGVHDSAAATWVDLAGGLDLTMLVNGRWGSNCVVANGAVLAKRTCSLLMSSLVCCEVVVSQGTANKMQGTVVWFDNGKKKDQKYFCMENEMVYSKYGNYAFNLGRANSYSLNWNNIVCYGDGVLLGRVSHEYNPDAVGGEIVIGSRAVFMGSYGFYLSSGIKIHSIRIYNRTLTYDEIAHNYDIDKERFGL